MTLPSAKFPPSPCNWLPLSQLAVTKKKWHYYFSQNSSYKLRMLRNTVPFFIPEQEADQLARYALCSKWMPFLGLVALNTSCDDLPEEKGTKFHMKKSPQRGKEGEDHNMFVHLPYNQNTLIISCVFSILCPPSTKKCSNSGHSACRTFRYPSSGSLWWFTQRGNVLLGLHNLHPLAQDFSRKCIGLVEKGNM